jgi:Ras-related protein Rab-14
LVVYDVTRRDTFAHISSWLTDVQNNTNKETEIILIGNKSDLEENREVTFEEAQQFAEENNLMFLECSAKNGDHVGKAFESTAKSIYHKVRLGNVEVDVKDSGVSGGPAYTGDAAAKNRPGGVKLPANATVKRANSDNGGKAGKKCDC